MIISNNESFNAIDKKVTLKFQRKASMLTIAKIRKKIVPVLFDVLLHIIQHIFFSFLSKPFPLLLLSDNFSY